MEKLRAYSSTSSSSFESISAASSSLGYYYQRRRRGSFCPPCFLDACYRCKKRIGDGRDVYMYRGDLPFCSEECRQRQIGVDEDEESKNKIVQKLKLKLSAKMKAEGEEVADEPKAVEVRAVNTAIAC